MCIRDSNKGALTGTGAGAWDFRYSFINGVSASVDVPDGVWGVMRNFTNSGAINYHSGTLNIGNGICYDGTITFDPGISSTFNNLTLMPGSCYGFSYIYTH